MVRLMFYLYEQKKAMIRMITRVKCNVVHVKKEILNIIPMKF